MPLPQDTILGHYKICLLLGAGGMGEVYLAQDITLGRKVALKFLPADFTSDEDRLNRFKREAYAASSLNHPNILTIYEIGSENRHHFIATEFIEGETLRHYIERPLSDLCKVLDIGIQVASALSAAHAAGIVHRDIKPENIMLRKDSLVKVVDFGLVKLIEKKTEREQAIVNTDVSTVEMRRTTPGTVIGTVNYMSPEQARGLEVDARTDIWSLGIVLYELISNKAPFTGETKTDVLATILKSNPLPLSYYAPETPDELQRIVKKTLCKDREERYQTADELITELQKIRNKLNNVEQKSTKIFRRDANTSPNTKSNLFSSFVNKSPKSIGLILALTIFALFAYFLSSQFSTAPPKTEALKLFNNGTEALRDGTYYKASKMFEDAIKIDGSFALAHALLAESWMELDYVGRAQNELLKVRDFQQQKQGFLSAFSPTDDESLYTEAINATVLSDFPKAAGIYQTIANRHPDEPYAYLDLGRAYEKNEEVDKAIEYYENAATLNPQYGAAFLRLGILRNRKAEFEKSDKAFDTAENIYDRLSNDEGVSEVKYQRGVSLNLQEKLDAARAQFEQVLNTPRTSKYQQIRAMLQISSICSSGGKTDCAQDYASNAIKMAKEERMENLATNGLIDLGNAFLTRAEYEKAEQQYKQAIEFARKDEGHRNEARAFLALGSLRIQQIKPDEAENFVKQALPFFQKGGYHNEITKANILLGRASEMREDYAAALKAFEQAETSEDASLRAYANLAAGNVLMHQEQYPEARRRFEQSYDLYQSLSNQFYLAYSLLYLSEVLCRLGYFQEAKDKLAKVQTIVNEGGGSLSQLAGKIHLINAQIALSERNFAKAVKDAEQVGGTADSSAAFETNRIIGLAQTISNSKAGEGVQKCVTALRYAADTKDPRTINIAKLALAEAYLNTGSYADALATALQAKDYFAAAGQPESAWRSWLIAARASRQKGDEENAGEYASKARETLSGLQTDWGEENFKTYLAKPDINLYFKQIEELTQS
ncbi:hypothetical protein BH24ACI2_BH24ACI2_02000 [soil metagenome]